MGRKIWLSKIVPGFIVFVLWLNGWFFPLILLPLFYVILVEKKSWDWLGFSIRNLRPSLVLSILIIFVLIGVYSPIFVHYLSDMLNRGRFNLYDVFLDVVWYPVYEEITYRSFALSHFANLDESYHSSKNLIVNVTQSLLFLSIHKHHFSLSLVLIPVFLLAFLNGILFLRTRNICGCIVSHSVLNGFALLLRYSYG